MAGQYVAYTFFKVDPAWRRLPIEERSAGKDAFAEAVEDWAGRMASLRAYSVAGVRPDADFFPALPMTAYNAVTGVEIEATRRLIELLQSCVGGRRLERRAGRRADRR